MALTVNIHEAKTHFSKLLARVAAGEEVIVARAGKPIAKISAIRPDRPNREPGWAKGLVWFAPDVDAPLSEEELKLWYEGDIFPK